MKPEKSLTLTHYTLGDMRSGNRHFLEQGMDGSNWSESDLKEHTHTYRVGMTVEVHSYGAWRPGRVTGLGSRMVEVTYARNKAGLSHTKRFHAVDIRPAPARRR